MPSRALFSLVIALTGTLAAPAAPAGPEMGNQQFQPGLNPQPAVHSPAGMMVVRPSLHLARAGVVSAQSHAWASARVTVLQPAAVAISPVTFSRKS